MRKKAQAPRAPVYTAEVGGEAEYEPTSGDWYKLIPVRLATPDGVIECKGSVVLPGAYREGDETRSRAPFHDVEIPYRGKVLACRAQRGGTEWRVALEAQATGRSTHGRQYGAGEGASLGEAVEAACRGYAAALRKERAAIDRKLAEWDPDLPAKGAP